MFVCLYPLPVCLLVCLYPLPLCPCLSAGLSVPSPSLPLSICWSVCTLSRSVCWFVCTLSLSVCWSVCTLSLSVCWCLHLSLSARTDSPSEPRGSHQSRIFWSGTCAERQVEPAAASGYQVLYRGAPNTSCTVKLPIDSPFSYVDQVWRKTRQEHADSGLHLTLTRCIQVGHLFRTMVPEEDLCVQDFPFVRLCCDEVMQTTGTEPVYLMDYHGVQYFTAQRSTRQGPVHCRCVSEQVSGTWHSLTSESVSTSKGFHTFAEE